MSEKIVSGVEGLVGNVKVYDFDESIRASRYPMSTDVTKTTCGIGKNTITLGSCGIGQGHDNFLNGVRVAFDLTFSNKAWVEAERYHFFDFVSSQSTMHCITKFDIQKQCNEYVDPRIIAVLQEKVDQYNALPNKDTYLDVLYNVPSGFQLTARMTTDYRQLKTIYYQRKDHRLPEWREFCKWMLTLPWFSEIVLGAKQDESN